MKTVRFALLVLVALGGSAQEERPTERVGAADRHEHATRSGSVTGVVRNAVTGEPVPNVEVNLRSGKVFETVRSGINGSYSIRKLDPGRYALEARREFQTEIVVTRMITVRAGEELTGIDLRLLQPAVVTGIVTDERRRPLAGVPIRARWTVYFQGALKEYGGPSATTNDLGEYRLMGLKPGNSYTVAAGLPAPVPVAAGIGAVPAGRSAWQRLYYPDSPIPEGSVMLNLRSGEVREGVDFRMRRVPSFCASGVVSDAPTGAARVSISTADHSPGWSVLLGQGETDAAGKFSICDLPPGPYRVTAYPLDGTGYYGTSDFEIFDRHVRSVNVALRHCMEVHAETRWEGAPPSAPVSEISLSLTPLGRGFLAGESQRANLGVPGEFSFSCLFPGRYMAKLSGLAEGVYARDITYGTESALFSPIPVGNGASGTPIRVLLAHDGGSIRVQVRDRDQKPVQNAGLCLFPPGLANEEALAHFYIPYGTDQDGNRAVTNLAPGRYYVFATVQPFDPTPMMLSKLFQARSRAKEVEVASGRIVDVTLEPINIE